MSEENVNDLDGGAKKPVKVCWFLQRRFANIGHTLSWHLLQSGRRFEFCALVGSRFNLNFLSAQTDVPYTNLILDEDIYAEAKKETLDLPFLQKFEREYGLPNLWPYLYIDRILMTGQFLREYPYNRPTATHEEMLIVLQTYAKKIVHFLETEKPDAVIVSVIASVGSFLLYHIAQKKGIRTINIDFARIKNRVVLSEDYRRFSWIEKLAEEISGGRPSACTAEAKDFLETFRTSPLPHNEQALPEFRNQTRKIFNLRFFRPAHFFESLRWHTKELWNGIVRGGNDFTDIKPWHMIYDKARRKIRGVIGYDNLYSTLLPEDAYAFFPLHFEPEIGLLLYAPHNTDQVHLVKQMARSLPVGMFLYVKDHPQMIGYRERSFYKSIARIPNVKLLNPSLRSGVIIPKAKLVFSISSTAGWEAVFLKKPVITFGDVFYNALPSVQRCHSFEELSDMVFRQLNNFTFNEKVLVEYVSAVFEDSVPAPYERFWTDGGDLSQIKANEGIQALAKLIGSKLR